MTYLLSCDKWKPAVTCFSTWCLCSWMKCLFVCLSNLSLFFIHLISILAGVTGLMASQKKRNGVLLLTETILASSATQRISNRSAEQSRPILPGRNSTTRTAETGRREDPSPCTNATWEPELPCRACRTIARVGTESLAGRRRAAWTPAKETSGKRTLLQPNAVSSASLREGARGLALNLSFISGLTSGPIRLRTERSGGGGGGPGPSVRGGPSSSRGRSSFSGRDGKPMTMNNQVSTPSPRLKAFMHLWPIELCVYLRIRTSKCKSINCRVAISPFSLVSPCNSLDAAWLKSPPSPQPFSSGRQVVVERHSRDSGLRKEWQSGSNSQDRAFPENRRMESRGSLMGSSRYNSFRHNSLYSARVWCELQAVLSVCSHSSSGLNRIVQITSNSISSGGNTGGFKSYKGTPRQF